MDGKKKKNKKKKGNNQSRTADDASASVEEVVITEQDNGSVPQLNRLPQVLSTTDVQSVAVSESDVELDRHKLYEQKFIKLQEEVRQLQDGKSQWLQKEASLEEKIKLLQNDVDSCIRKEVGLEEKLENLRGGNDLFIQKEATLEDRIKHIEGIKDSWILKETLINEMASRLDEVNSRLQEQVKELKESRDGLIQENTQLRERIAVTESRIQRIETEVLLSKSFPMMITESPVEKIPEYQPEAAPPPLVEKREPENMELVEKVKEVHVEFDQLANATDNSSTPKLDHQHANATDNSSTPKLDHVKRTAESVKRPAESVLSIDYAPEYGQEMYESGEIIPSLARAHNPFGIPNGVGDFGSLNGVRQGQLLGLDNPRISEDIVSVPLDDIQVQDGEPQTAKEEETSLPLSDAPLIGAPFRLISFFAKYVSGADLVHQDGERSG